MATLNLTHRALLDRVLPVDRLPAAMQLEIARALESDDERAIERTAATALRELITLGLVRATGDGSAGDRRYHNLMTGEIIALRSPEPAADQVVAQSLPIAGTGITSTLETTRELLGLASRLLSEGGSELAETDQIVELLSSYGRQLLECDEVRFVGLDAGSETAPQGAEDSPFVDAMLEQSRLRRRQILSIRDRSRPGDGWRSYAAVPIGVPGERIHGYLEARSTGLAHFTRARLALLELLAETGHELFKNSEQLQKLVFIDSRTQIFNKSFFDIELSQFLARARREGRQMALAIVDIDDFKSFNSRYGYHGGDQVLFRVAQILKSHIRPFDVVARWGGEEFAILLAPPVEQENAMNICDRLRLAIQQSSFRVSDLKGREHRVSVTVSVGGSLYPYDGQTADELWRRANEALLVAKTAGKNLVRFRQRQGSGRESRSA